MSIHSILKKLSCKEENIPASHETEINHHTTRLIVGVIAVVLMFIEIMFSIFGHSISMNMMLPMGLIQLILPIWLVIKGLNSSALETEMK